MNSPASLSIYRMIRIYENAEMRIQRIASNLANEE